MNTKSSLILLLVIFLGSFLTVQLGCKKDIVESENSPSVTTDPITIITHNSNIGGRIKGNKHGHVVVAVNGLLKRGIYPNTFWGKYVRLYNWNNINEGV